MLTPTENTFISKELLHKCLEAMSQSYVFYPLKEGEEKQVYAPLIDWFGNDPVDAVDFNVLEEPKWHYYSDIAIMQYEWYVEEILENPFIKALKVLSEAGLLKEITNAP